MKKIRNVLLGVFLFSILALNVSLFAQSNDDWTNKLQAFQRQIDVGVQDIWNAGRTESYLNNNGYQIIVPYNYNSEGFDADCLNFDYVFPELSEYNRIANPYENDNLRGIQYYGRMGANRSLIDKYGLSEDVASYGRKIATWQWAKDNGVPGNDTQTGFTNLQGNGSLSADESNRLIAFIHELRGQVLTNTPTYFNINFNGEISQKNPQRTSAMSINEYFGYTVEVTTPAEVVDVNGNIKKEFSAGEQFIVRAPGNFIGELKVTATVEQIFYNMLYFQATVNGNQDLLTFDNGDPLKINGDMILNFKGAYDIIDITKRTQDKQLLANTVYEIADNSNFENAQKFTTDEKGNIRLEELLLPDEVLYIREYSAPILNEHHGYNISPGISKIKGIGGDTHVLEFENEKIKGKICINKTDQNSKPLHNVQFDLLTNDGRFLDSKATDPNGKLCFEDLELGLYKIVERTPDDYTGEQLVYDVDVKIDEELIMQRQNTQSDYEANVLLEIVNEKIVSYNPIIKTIATGVNGEKDFKLNSDIEFIDYVEYIDLAPNQEYTLKGVIMDKATGQPLLIDNEQVIASTTFTPNKLNGVTEVYYKFNTTGFENKDLVVFETLMRDDEVIVKHHDINDVGQTIHIRDNILPSTGQQIIESLAIGIIIFTSSGFGLVYCRKRGKKHFTHD